MACQQLGHQTNAVEWSRSSFENALSGQINSDIPFNHPAMIHTNEYGRVIVDSSPSVRDGISVVIPTEARRKFMTALGQKFGFQEPNTCSRPRAKPHQHNIPVSLANYSAVDTSEIPVSTSDDFSSFDDKKTFIRIGDTERVISYYKSALHHFRQNNCRKIARAFIGFIEPRKWRRHPYNGSMRSTKLRPGRTCHPEQCKPEWWPPGVKHSDPDQLYKAERIELLVHIIRKLRGNGTTADYLKRVTSDTMRSKGKGISRVETLFEILRVRKMEECYECGEVDGNVLIDVINCGLGPKTGGVEGSTDGAGDPTMSGGVARNIEEDLSTPSLSIEQPVASPTTPTNKWGTIPHSLPGNFSVAEPLTSDIQPTHPFYATSSQYPNSFSQGMHRTTAAPAIPVPHNVPVFNFQCQSPFPTWNPIQQCGELLSP